MSLSLTGLVCRLSVHGAGRRRPESRDRNARCDLERTGSSAPGLSFIRAVMRRRRRHIHRRQRRGQLLRRPGASETLVELARPVLAARASLVLAVAFRGHVRWHLLQNALRTLHEGMLGRALDELVLRLTMSQLLLLLAATAPGQLLLRRALRQLVLRFPRRERTFGRLLRFSGRELWGKRVRRVGRVMDSRRGGACR